MHQPASQPRHSIYYDYQVFDYRRAPEQAGTTSMHQVVVVGAGPIGLVTALGLASRGVACVLLEAERQVSEGSRAIVFTRRSMEILQQVGVAGPMMALGLPWRFGNSFYRGHRVFRMESPHDEHDRFPPMLNLQQQYVEQFLVEQVLRQPLIDLRWGHRVVDVLRNDDSVALRVDTPDGEYTLQSGWVVAADGARSGLRSRLGLALEGDSYEGRFVIADIRIELDLPTERLAFFDPEWNPGNTVLMHREPGNIWRIDYRLPDGESPEEALSEASLGARIDAQLAMIGKGGRPWTLDWCSVYSARALTLPDYRSGRVFFCGDAAHLLPIFGVRGANTGLQDAQNLAWKLAFVCKRRAPETLLATYSAERVAAAREIIEEAGKSTRFMTPPTRGFLLLRDAVLSLSITQPFVRPLFHWRTSRPHDYLDSALNSVDDDNARIPGGYPNGSVAGNAKVGENAHLFDHLGAGFTLLLFGNVASLEPDMRSVLGAVHALGPPATPPMLDVIALVRSHDGLQAPGVRVLQDNGGEVFERYGFGNGTGMVLLRPDHHVCARFMGLDARRLARAFERVLGPLEELSR